MTFSQEPALNSHGCQILLLIKALEEHLCAEHEPVSHGALASDFLLQYEPLSARKLMSNSIFFVWMWWS